MLAFPVRQVTHFPFNRLDAAIMAGQLGFMGLHVFAQERDLLPTAFNVSLKLLFAAGEKALEVTEDSQTGENQRQPRNDFGRRHLRAFSNFV
ncbi:hypothetical protein AGR4C_Lc50127 [Agrobacterium tumefaciens str. Kerr 14]|uniref:Uncharacterized protein n=1 Tax=Agrobacterium tumefaciens str. Kerr 14 TaxID=1183424 RepID=A0A1S7RUS3_AGRTU|nr:hypothetical protein AGR4C_Lc50127 [Agrobacterium tumefaciens str. Kerr 14]